MIDTGAADYYVCFVIESATISNRFVRDFQHSSIHESWVLLSIVIAG